MSMNITIRENNGVTVIDLSGRLTLGGAPAMLRDDIRQLLDDGKTRLLLNLAGLTHLDSAGMGLLVRAYATVGEMCDALRDEWGEYEEVPLI